MNSRQRTALLICAVVIAAMLLYPPFHHSTAAHNFGYSWIFSPPHPVATVNVPLLVAQWVGVAIVGVIAYFLLAGEPGNQTSSATTLRDHAPPPVEGRKAIRPFRSASIAALIGFFVGFIGFTNPQCAGRAADVVCLVAMLLAGVGWGIALFVLVLVVQLVRTFFRSRRAPTSVR